MSNGYAVYPQCLAVQTLRHARRLAIEASMKQENGYESRVESCDTLRTIARYRRGELID